MTEEEATELATVFKDQLDELLAPYEARIANLEKFRDAALSELAKRGISLEGLTSSGESTPKKTGRLADAFARGWTSKS